MKYIKDILQKTCVFFTISIMIFSIVYSIIASGQSERLNVASAFLEASWFTPGMSAMFLSASLIAGIAAQIFKITKIPAFSRHIAFFILLYADFLFVVIPLSSHTTNQGTTIYLSAAFIVVYFIIFGIYMGIKAAVNASRNKKSSYEEVYKDAE